jgi:hypothetical protein
VLKKRDRTLRHADLATGPGSLSTGVSASQTVPPPSSSGAPADPLARRK